MRQASGMLYAGLPGNICSTNQRLSWAHERGNGPSTRATPSAQRFIAPRSPSVLVCALPMFGILVECARAYEGSRVGNRLHLTRGEVFLPFESPAQSNVRSGCELIKPKQ